MQQHQHGIFGIVQRSFVNLRPLGIWSSLEWNICILPWGAFRPVPAIFFRQIHADWWRWIKLRKGVRISFPPIPSSPCSPPCSTHLPPYSTSCCLPPNSWVILPPMAVVHCPMLRGPGHSLLVLLFALGSFYMKWYKHTKIVFYIRFLKSQSYCPTLHCSAQFTGMLKSQQ